LTQKVTETVTQRVYVDSKHEHNNVNLIGATSMAGVGVCERTTEESMEEETVVHVENCEGGGV